ncbi:MAG: SOS response-associated peptidase [Anaerolineae bacterium]|nr:SOS response-associated peptidase [Anaerolineae bacterium]
MQQTLPKIRYTLTQPDLVHRRFGTSIPLSGAPQYNLHPGMYTPILLWHEGRAALTQGVFGFVPPWDTNMEVNSLLIARSETVLEKGTFRDAFANTRCLVVADGFYLWDGKQPYYVRLKSRQLFGIAGIFAVNYHHRSPLVSFALLTAEANPATWHIHRRTCVIIEPEDEAAYLNPESPLEDIILMLEAYPEDRMEVIKVSPRLTRATNNSPSFVQHYEGDAEEPNNDIQHITGQRSLFE